MLRLEHCIIWLRDLYTKKIPVEVFGELEDNEEDKYKAYKIES